MKHQLMIGLIAAINLLSACQSVQTTSAGTVGVDRRQRMSPLVSEQQLEQESAQAYTEVLGQERGKGNVDADPAMTARVRAIAQRIIPVTTTFRPEAKNWKWEVHVIRSDQLNAWCMPGGKIAFYSAIITKLNLTDDEIAAIMGHEVAHALREHARERASEQLPVQIGAVVLSAATGSEASGQLAQVAYQVAAGLPHSRTHEIEADRIGVELAARAGYNPRAAVKLWEKMAAASGGKGGPEWMSTHPSSESRIKDLQVYSERVAPLYEQAKK